MPVSPLDLIIAIPILLFLVHGIRKGFIEEVLGLLGQVIAIFLAFTYMYILADFWKEFYSIDSGWIPLVSFLVIYIVAIVLVRLLIKVLESFIKLIRLSIVNRIFGGLFAAFKGALLISVFLVLLSLLDQPSRENKDASLLYEYILTIAPKTYDVIARVYPGVKDFTDQVGEYFDSLDINSIVTDHSDQEQ